MTLKAVLVPVLVVFALGLASCGGSGGDTSSEASETAAAPGAPAEPGGTSGTAGEKLQRSVKVEIADFAYHPDPVRVQTGGKVIWQNQDSAPHTATADDGSFDTGTIEEGKLKSETFKQAGTYTYFCEIHPTMHGTLEVVDAE